MSRPATFARHRIAFAITVSCVACATAGAATLELNCGQPAIQHLSVDMTKGTVLSETKNDPKQYGPGSGYRGVWEPVTSYTAPAKISPTLISWVIYQGPTPFYFDLDRNTGILTDRWPAGPDWNRVTTPCTPGTMSFPATRF